MSELAVGSLAGLAANSYEVSIASGSTLDLTNATGLPSGSLPAGSVLQVVQERKVDQFSTSSSSYVDVTAWAASITPTSTSSKILILVTGSAGSSLAQIAVVSEFQLLRNATAIGNSADNKFYGFAHDANRYSWPIAGDFLDSPATTSEVTYQVQVRATGGTTYVNSDGAGRHTNTSSITLMEVAG